MARPLFNNHWAYDPSTVPGEDNQSPSLTIPDMSMSIQEMIAKLRIGTLPADFVRDVLYSDSDDFDEVTDELVAAYDISDKHEELKRLRLKFERMRELRKKAAEASQSLSDGVSISKGDNPSPQPSEQPTDV